jgi:hypothetical protein
MNEPTNSQLLIYQTEDGRIKLDVRFEGEKDRRGDGVTENRIH